MTRSTLVLGGARSGKSAHAERLLPSDAPVTYLATARRDPADEEWERRIAAHVVRRPDVWRTAEVRAAAELADLLAAAPPEGLLLLDDVVSWLAGLLDENDVWRDEAAGLPAARRETARLVEAVRDCAGRLVVVTSEIGLGVVPGSGAGRLFRDELGTLNERLAEVCDEVLLIVAGLPLTLKGDSGGQGCSCRAAGEGGAS